MNLIEGPEPVVPSGPEPFISRLVAVLGEPWRRVVSAGEVLVEIDELDADGGLSCRAGVVEVQAGGRFDRIIVQHGDGAALDLLEVTLKEGASFRQFVLSSGATLARLETHVTVEGEGGEVALNGIYLCGPGRHCDMASQVTHKVGPGHTRQLIKGAARKGGRGVFQGKIMVAPGAQKTDAEQHHDALLLEEGAEIYAKPELEIHADDVACAHGNTIGALDEQALFYMRQRGAPKAAAQALLVEAFVRGAVPEWLPAEIAGEVDQRIAQWLEGQS
jgi:Fe-S cluster assembly protein SufD